MRYLKNKGNTGRKFSKEHREKISLALKTYTRTEEHTQKILEGQKARRLTPQQRLDFLERRRKHFSSPKYKLRKKEYDKAYKSRPEIRERDWSNWLRKTYGLTIASYNQLVEKQKGICAICLSARSVKRKKVILVIDHDHKTGAIRGLLCDRCNRGLGLMGDNIESLKRAIKYLNE